MSSWWQRTKRAAGRAARSAGSSVGTAVGAVAGGIAGAPLGPAGIAAGAALGAKAGEYVGGVGGRVVGRGLESAPTPKGGPPVAPLIPSSAVSYADGATLTLDASGGGKLRGRFGTVSGFVGTDGVWRSASVARAAYAPGGVTATGAAYKGTIGGKVYGAPVAGVKLSAAPAPKVTIKPAPVRGVSGPAPVAGVSGPAASAAAAEPASGLNVTGDTSALAAAVEEEGVIGYAKANPGKTAAIGAALVASAAAAAKLLKWW